MILRHIHDHLLIKFLDGVTFLSRFLYNTCCLFDLISHLFVILDMNLQMLILFEEYFLHFSDSGLEDDRTLER